MLADTISVEASVSRNLATFAISKEADTVLPGDSLIFQSNILPSQGTKTLGHWWTMDSILMPDFFFKWAFTTPGKHLAIFSVIDQFGDTLSDTVPILINTPPTLTRAVLPADSAWGVSQGLISAQLFSWAATDPDSATTLQFRMRLHQTSCTSQNKDTLLLDTIVNQAHIELWNLLKPLCAYQWSVIATDNWGGHSDSTQTFRFSTASLDGTAAIRVKTERAGLKAALRRFAGIQTYASNAGDSAQILFSSLLPGIYHISISDSLHPGFQPESLTLNLERGQLLDLPIHLNDILPPTIICASCINDTLPGLLPFALKIVETGSGLLVKSVSVKLDQVNLPWTLHNDSLFLQKPSRQLIAQLHPIEISLQDSSGNDTTLTFWVRGGP